MNEFNYNNFSINFAKPFSIVKKMQQSKSNLFSKYYKDKKNTNFFCFSFSFRQLCLIVFFYLYYIKFEILFFTLKKTLYMKNEFF